MRVSHLRPKLGRIAPLPSPVICWLVALIGVQSPFAETFTLGVDARHNLFGAGHTTAPAPIGAGEGLLPPHVWLPAGEKRILTFSYVIGSITLNRGIPGLVNDPDGNGSYGGLYYLPFNGISGLTNLNQFGFLAGVFLSADEPLDPVPPALDFTDGIGLGRSFKSLAPLLNQTFFIGDGRTGSDSGEVQQFLVPEGATRLYLGILDTIAPGQRPGYYGDNAGNFTATFQVAPSGTHPVTNDLRSSIELSTNGLTLRCELPNSDGVLFVVADPNIEDLYDSEVLTSFAFSSNSIGTIEVPRPTSHTMFYGFILAASSEVSSGVAWVPAGTFVMGSPENEVHRLADETEHSVALTNGFYLLKNEITQWEYTRIMGANPSAFTEDLSNPVEQVSWADATNFCAKLTESERRLRRLPEGWSYRLPTEAEWEYACRAGTTTPFHYGNDLRSGMANFVGTHEYVGGIGTANFPEGTYRGRTARVRSYQPNAFGIYDMHGNVWEWCSDWYGPFTTAAVANPTGTAAGPHHIIRGGGWNRWAQDCRSALRNVPGPNGPDHAVGFRYVLAADGD